MLSKVLYDAMEQIIGDRDNINPALLINSATDFSNFDFANFQDTSESLSLKLNQVQLLGQILASETNLVEKAKAKARNENTHLVLNLSLLTFSLENGKMKRKKESWIMRQGKKR